MKFITIRIWFYIFCDWFMVITIKFRHEVFHFLMCDIPWASKSHHQGYFKSTARDGRGPIACWRNRAIYSSSFFFNVKVGMPWNLPSEVAIQSPEVFLEKSVLKICNKFTGEHPCRSVISIKLLCNFVETTLRHGCSPVILLFSYAIGAWSWASTWVFYGLLYVLCVEEDFRRASSKTNDLFFNFLVLLWQC